MVLLVWLAALRTHGRERARLPADIGAREQLKCGIALLSVTIAGDKAQGAVHRRPGIGAFKTRGGPARRQIPK
jgi:hypothetical protein